MRTFSCLVLRWPGAKGFHCWLIEWLNSAIKDEAAFSLHPCQPCLSCHQASCLDTTTHSEEESFPGSCQQFLVILSGHSYTTALQNPLLVQRWEKLTLRGPLVSRAGLCSQQPQNIDFPPDQAADWFSSHLKRVRFPKLRFSLPVWQLTAVQWPHLTAKGAGKCSL